MQHAVYLHLDLDIQLRPGKFIRHATLGCRRQCGNGLQNERGHDFVSKGLAHGNAFLALGWFQKGLELVLNELSRLRPTHSNVFHRDGAKGVLHQMVGITSCHYLHRTQRTYIRTYVRIGIRAYLATPEQGVLALVASNGLLNRRQGLTV